MSKKKLYIETYGCQMNVVDSEVVVAILQKQEYELTEKMEEANLILVNTCSIRDNAEQKVNNRIKEFGRQKKINKDLVVGVIGCMAERLKDKLLEEERSVDLVVGPDAYRELPALLQEVESGQKGINTLLSLEETYADLSPVRLDKNHVSSFVSIMRGCNNFCAYCVVPYTRGRERSRDPETIEREVRELFEKGYKEVTLLGQNVNSYEWAMGSDVRFEGLLERIAQISPKLRVRFATSHPKDMSDELLQTISKYPNLCKSIHLPVQSGSSSVLKRMKRGYTREMYENRIKAIRKILPGTTISTDIITGFCGESEDEHKETMSLMKWADYDFAYMFKYSERPDTFAAKNYKDDVPEEIKTKRLSEIIALQGKLSLASKQKDIGKTFEVLVEGTSKKSKEQLFGRTSQNKVVVFPSGGHKPGDYVQVKVNKCTSATLLGDKVKE
ncbi:MAG: tRNA (N6-isopentenyl adenosine(37)-C2)-methylthiotransferase MiaB [Bacteroidales bacterium]|jgi:tRNA-2-methylthio-N6-dimethylallyladenosine synthase|nr:tRNA (N6-isopentenyl adenosine(37)-C2)-methylthiotransferase MiaB [Bacteroidales bacterium]